MNERLQERVNLNNLLRVKRNSFQVTDENDLFDSCYRHLSYALLNNKDMLFMHYAVFHYPETTYEIKDFKEANLEVVLFFYSKEKNIHYKEFYDFLIPIHKIKFYGQVFDSDHFNDKLNEIMDKFDIEKLHENKNNLKNIYDMLGGIKI